MTLNQRKNVDCEEVLQSLADEGTQKVKTTIQSSCVC